MKKTILTIVLAMLCLILSLQSQDQDTITGTISTQDRKPLAGVTIKIMDTDISTITDENGKFSLVSKTKKGILTFSYTGYETQSMDYIMGREDKFKIFMRELRSQLQEIEINAGYYTVKDRARTGSIGRITAKTIEKQTISNPLQALQNQIPGVEITQQTGVPGGAFKVQIRGRTSINTAIKNDPLYLIDGVQYPSSTVSANSSAGILSPAGSNSLSFINPYDIESIEILKDADATAIYGSRGTNGVVLITTKKGKTGKIKIGTGFTQGFNQVAHRLDLLKTEPYLQMRKEAFKNDGLDPGPRDYDLNGFWDQNRYTDWQEELIGKNASVTNASLSASGGTEKSNYLLGVNYYKEGTVFPGAFGFKRVNLQSSLNLGIPTDRFNLNFSANYNHTTTNLMRTDITNLILLPPNAPAPYDEFGNINWSDNTVYTNPMARLLQINDSGTDNLITNVQLNYRIITNLVLKASVGYSTIKREEFAKSPLASQSSSQTLTAANRASDFSNNYNNSFILEPQLSYSLPLPTGKFEAMIGSSFQETEAGFRTIRGTGFNSDELMENIGSASLLTNSSAAYNQYRYTALFGRINYVFKDRYYLNLTGRRDGSSRFGKGRQFANFGAIGAAWIFSDENFIKPLTPFLSFGKLRASYGITGNDQIPDYGFLQLWRSLGTYQGSSTLSPTRIANPEYAWETNKKAEVALQFGFLANRLTMEIATYRTRSSNQLISQPLPLSSGSNSIQVNLPATVQNTGWEFTANLKLFNHTDWQWTTGLNLTIPKNKLISYPGGVENSIYYMDYVVGEPLTIRKIYNVKGVNSETGLYDIEDVDGNGVLDNNDRIKSKFLGQYFYGGIQNTINYKQFNLDFLFSFNKQTGINYLGSTFSPGYFDYYGPLNNQLSIVFNRWQQTGDQATGQKFSTKSDAYVQYAQATRDLGGYAIGDASYIRLKNIAISYSLSQTWLKRLNIDAARISLQGQNVFTLTNYTGLDPESQTMQQLPPLRSFSLVINLTF